MFTTFHKFYFLEREYLFCRYNYLGVTLSFDLITYLFSVAYHHIKKV